MIFVFSWECHFGHIGHVVCVWEANIVDVFCHAQLLFVFSKWQRKKFILNSVLKIQSSGVISNLGKAILRGCCPNQGFMIGTNTSKTVSYTHLDVYKRQP